MLCCAKPSLERRTLATARPGRGRSSCFNDRHFQSPINGLKRLLESVHAGSVANIEDAVNLWHVPPKPTPKFSLCNSLLLHRFVQFDLRHCQWWNSDRQFSSRGLWQPLPIFHVRLDHGQKGVRCPPQSFFPRVPESVGLREIREVHEYMFTLGCQLHRVVQHFAYVSFCARQV